MAISLFSACSNHYKHNQSIESTQYDQQTNTFKNSEIEYKTTLSNIWDITKAYFNDNRTDATPRQPVPVLTLTKQQLTKTQNDFVVRLGHSSMLAKLNGEFVLFDPVFSERASITQWLGPKRFHPTPISIDALPAITAVIISHDHYDHLDKQSVKQLAAKTTQFIVPLEVGKHLLDWGVPASQITELDWWESTTLANLTFTATPAQHFSGRGLMDKDKTLWASWVVKGWDSNLFFSGDSGYFSGFKEIGERMGPFDLTMIETGAYNERWKEIHMLPEESVEAHIDLQGRAMIPVHNSTFDLALHDWFEPLERATSHALINDVQLLTPKIGELVFVKSPSQYDRWW